MEYWSSLVYLGVPVLNFMRREALEGLARDAAEVDFTPRLREIRIPTAVFVGRDRDARIPSDLADDALDSYRRAIPECRAVEFASSGHMIPDEEQERYVAEVESFLAALTGSRAPAAAGSPVGA